MSIKEQSPEWMITIYGDSNMKKVEFEELSSLRERINSAMLLWDYSSYYVNFTVRYFIIHGGRRIQPKIFLMMEDPTFLYAKRHTETLPINGNGEKIHTVTYLFGIEGTVDGEKKQLFAKISPDGFRWEWGNKR